MLLNLGPQIEACSKGQIQSTEGLQTSWRCREQSQFHFRVVCGVVFQANGLLIQVSVRPMKNAANKFSSHHLTSIGVYGSLWLQAERKRAAEAQSELPRSPSTSSENHGDRKLSTSKWRSFCVLVRIRV